MSPETEIMIQELISYLAPILAGFITTVVIPLLIKKATSKMLDKKVTTSLDKMDNATKLLETRDADIMKEIANIKETLDIMRGKTPKTGR